LGGGALGPDLFAEVDFDRRTLLKQGVDYSIMFYRGRLLAHLSASEETIEEFIELLRLNRFSSIVIDSDMSCTRFC
jgi:hypothetical protein